MFVIFVIEKLATQLWMSPFYPYPSFFLQNENLKGEKRKN